MKRCVALFLCMLLVCLPVSAAGQTKLVALTFDDGPSGRFTRRLLDGLSQRDVKATFLLCGYRMEQYPELTQQIHALGHEVGLHGYSHKTLQHAGRTEAEEEIRMSMPFIPHGCKITFFRSPGGLNSNQMLEVAREHGLSLLLWSVDPKDWATQDAQAVTKSVVDRVKDGDIILMHDMSDSSVDAALQIIDQLHKKGFRFVTASQLAKEKNIPLIPGKEYRRFGS